MRSQKSYRTPLIGIAVRLDERTRPLRLLPCVTSTRHRASVMTWPPCNEQRARRTGPFVAGRASFRDGRECQCASVIPVMRNREYSTADTDGGARWRSQLRGAVGQVGKVRGTSIAWTDHSEVSINTGLRKRLFNSALGFSSTRRPLVREVRLSDEACDFRRSAHPDTSTARPSWARPRRADGSPEASGLLVGPMGEGYGHVRHL